MSSVFSEYKRLEQELENRPVKSSQSESFDTIQYALKRMRLHIDPKKVIVVSGSNGKGSVCVTLEGLIKSTGARVGTVISPHLVNTTERIRINGRDISRSMFCEAYKVISDSFLDIKLSYIETLTLMSAWIFFSGKCTAPVEWAIFEVNVGGLWDVANALPHKNCVVAKLGSDHHQLLGKGLYNIAKHKYGIVSRFSKVVTFEPPKKLKPLVSAIKEKTRSRWEIIDDVDFEVIYRSKKVIFSVISKWGNAEINLPGRRGVENTMLALKMFELLKFNPSKHLHVLKKISWPGRMQRLEVEACRCPMFLSGDHNPQGIESLIELLEYYPHKTIHVLLSLSVDRDVDEMIKPLLKLNRLKLYVTKSPYKGKTLTSYKKWAKQISGSWAKPELAIKNVIQLASKEDIIIVTGSLYLVGWVKDYFAEKYLGVDEKAKTKLKKEAISNLRLQV